MGDVHKTHATMASISRTLTIHSSSPMMQRQFQTIALPGKHNSVVVLLLLTFRPAEWTLHEHEAKNDGPWVNGEAHEGGARRGRAEVRKRQGGRGKAGQEAESELSYSIIAGYAWNLTWIIRRVRSCVWCTGVSKARTRHVCGGRPWERVTTFNLCRRLSALFTFGIAKRRLLLVEKIPGPNPASTILVSGKKELKKVVNGFIKEERENRVRTA